MPVNTPSEVADPIAAITAAENEASSLDILVCGNCQSVFHFVEEFSEHKQKNDCEKADKSSLNSQGNKKPQVWAFLIWKNSQTKAADQQGSWKLYQRWCNMPESQRQSWVTAGRNIQAFINLSHARELNKVDANNKENEREIDEEIEEDFVVEKIVGKRYNHKKKRVEYLLKWEGYPPEQNTWEPLSNLTTCKSLLQEYERLAAQQANDKSPAARLAGVLKKDITPSPAKVPIPANKPSGIMSNKYFSDKKIETPTLQTQRKIVPATPLSNSLNTPKPLGTFDRYVATTPKIDAHKTDDNSPLKRGTISNTVDLASPALSPNDRRPTNILKKIDQGPGSIGEDDFDTHSLKRVSDGDDDLADDAKRSKLSDSVTEANKINEQPELPKSGIFKKSEVRDKFPSITTMLGKVDDPNSKSEDTKKPAVDQKGILKIDHSQMPELQTGIYKMSLKGGVVKVDSVAKDRTISATLPAMPGPKGGVLILGNRFDLSKVSKASPKAVASPEKASILRNDQSPAFRGIYPKTEPPKVAKPDFQKSFSAGDSAKKPVNALRKALGGPLPRGKGKTGIATPTSVSRLKSNFGKGYGDSMLDSSGARLVDGDGFLMEFCEYENSDMEDYSLPDDFPEELDMEPLSPPRPLTLDPETGKRLMRAEGEPTPQPTPEPSPEPSPVPSPVPQEMICKEEKDVTLQINAEGLILKTGEDGEGTYTEINGNTYKVTNAAEVGLLQNAAYAAQASTELKAIAVPAELGEEQHENANMITITGEDGLVYQVANAKLEGDTIVVASGEDEQQCVFVTEDGHQVMQRTNEDGSTVLTLESAYADAVAQLVPNQVNILPDGSQIYVKQEENGQVELVQIQGTEMGEQEATEEQEGQIAENADENSGQVVAQLIEAGEPAPGGGPRRVVLLLPDGNLMVTEVDEEQFAALELEK